MRFMAPAVFLLVLLLFPVSNAASADDYLSEALLPDGCEDRSAQLYPVDDFEDVIFNREYFYTLEEGKAQLDRSGGGTWKTLDFGIFGRKRSKSE